MTFFEHSLRSCVAGAFFVRIVRIGAEMEKREIFIEEIPFTERPVGAVAESPEDFWERLEEMEDPLLKVMALNDYLTR